MTALLSSPFMSPDARIYVAGHNGLVGSAIVRALRRMGYESVCGISHDELDLTDQAAVRHFFKVQRPDFVFLAAARVGGILANSTYPAEFFHSNALIQINVIDEAWRAGVRRLLFLGSSCIYPRECPQPMREEHLLSGPLEVTNRPYAVAKIAGVEMCRAYNIQYGTRFLAVMPTNLYGPRDNYDLQTSHVLPALIRRMHEAKRRGDSTVALWGTGSPRREFLYSDDLAEAAVFCMNLDDARYESLLHGPDDVPLLNIGCGHDQTIRELAETVREAVDFSGRIEWDASKPDGTPRKLLDVSRLFALGWRPRVSLPEGIRMAYEDFLKTAAS